MNVEENIQLFFSSKNASKYNNGLTSDCEFYLPVIELPSQHYIYVSVIQASIPYTFYNINSSNNALNYFMNFISYSFTIPPGNYNSQQLLSWINANTALVCSYSVVTNKFTFVNGTYDFNFLSSSTCLDLLGIVSTYSTSKSLTSGKCVNLLTTSCVCIHSNLLTGNYTINDKNDNTIIQSIPVAVPPYSMITFSNVASFRSCLYTNNISFINIRLLDQNNQPIDLNGCHWSMTISIDVVNFVS